MGSTPTLGSGSWIQVVSGSVGNGQTTLEVTRLLAFEGARARAYYNEARPLIGMVEEDSRPALWALIEIYSRVLARIDGRRYEVLGERIRLSTFEKSLIVLRAVR